MTFAGLVAAKNLSDVASVEEAWNNIGDGITYAINDITTSGLVIKGADIFALNGVSRVTTRDLLLLRGLTANAQPRLNTIADQISSGITLQNNALLRASPASSGDYTLDGNLSFTNVLINGIAVQSLSSAPFSGDTATTKITLDEVVVASGFKVESSVSSGVVASPDKAIPIRDNGYIYYLKAGQS